MTPLVADEHRARLEAVTAAAHITWMTLIGGQVQPFGDRVVATADPTAPDVQWMQHVVGMTPDDVGLVPEIVDWYRGLGLRPRFELASAEAFAGLANALTASGLRQTGFTDVLFGRPSRLEGAAAVGVDVQEVQPGSDDALAFGSVLLRGHEGPEDPVHVHAAACFPDQPGYHCYLARIHGEPAGQAILVVNQGVGYLANASVLPTARRRGAQRALIERRLADAAGAGCDLAATMANPGTISHRNLERAGLHVAYGKVMWTMV